MQKSLMARGWGWGGQVKDFTAALELIFTSTLLVQSGQGIWNRMDKMILHGRQKYLHCKTDYLPFFPLRILKKKKKSYNSEDSSRMRAQEAWGKFLPIFSGKLNPNSSSLSLKMAFPYKSILFIILSSLF